MKNLLAEYEKWKLASNALSTRMVTSDELSTGKGKEPKHAPVVDGTPCKFKVQVREDFRHGVALDGVVGQVQQLHHLVNPALS